MQVGGDRRSRKKAQTRTDVRDAAQELFAARGFEAVTIADVARHADVAVQTVFNHFATKEDLFFADRTPWVDLPARAVRERPDDVGPVETLRRFMQELIAGYPATVTAEWRRYLQVLHDSPDLRAAEMRLFRTAEQNLAAAVLEAWESRSGSSPRLWLSADLLAGQFLSAGRVLLAAQRQVVLGRASAVTSADIVATAAAVFDALAVGLQDLDARVGMPDPPARAGQAGSVAEVGSTTGSSTSDTSSATSASVRGTAKAV